jgi:hypothetical protein
MVATGPKLTSILSLENLWWSGWLPFVLVATVATGPGLSSILFSSCENLWWLAVLCPCHNGCDRTWTELNFIFSLWKFVVVSCPLSPLQWLRFYFLPLRICTLVSCPLSLSQWLRQDLDWAQFYFLPVKIFVLQLAVLCPCRNDCDRAQTELNFIFFFWEFVL